MNPALIWLLIALVLIGAETLSGEFVLLMLGAAALIAAGVSVVVAAPIVGIGAFSAASVLLVFAARPALKRRLSHEIEDSRMHTRAHVGTEAEVVSRVHVDGGQVRLGGEIWSARPVHEDDVLEVGTVALVVEIRGATAVVVPQN